MNQFYGSCATVHGLKRNKPQKNVAETGEILGPPPSIADKSSSARARRFELLETIRRIDPQHRTASCLWCRVSKGSQLNIVKDTETGKARFEGLRVCSRVWTCPVCAAKISERRALELSQAIGSARDQGIRVVLLTATVPHVRTDGLASLMEALGVAWRSFTTNRRSRALRSAVQLVGTIRNIEVTHGENGWHPHFHCLVFFRADGVDLPRMQEEWGAHWQHCAVKAGLRRPSDDHGLTIQDGDQAARYVSKWGLEHEMTKAMAKQSRRGGRTPFDLVDDFRSGLEPEKNAALWLEFASAMHGQRQLHWSRGLKDLLKVEDKDDEELIQEEESRQSELVVQLKWSEWKAIRARHRAVLLTLAETRPELIPGFLAERVRVYEGSEAVGLADDG